MTFPTRILAGFALLALAACSGGGGGGGGTPTPSKTIADTLAYTNPTGSGYLLVRNASSTSSHLILDLVGPASSVSGVGFSLSADQTKVTWSNVGSDKVNGPLFSNALVKTKLSGDVLQAGVYQKGTGAAVSTSSTSVLAQVAVDLKSGIPVNTTVALSAVSGKAVIMNPPANPAVTTPITILAGSLVAN